MTVIKIPVRVHGTWPKGDDSPPRVKGEQREEEGQSAEQGRRAKEASRSDVGWRPEEGQWPEVRRQLEVMPMAPAPEEGAAPASETATRPDGVRAPGPGASEPCLERPAPETGSEQDELLFDVLSIADNLERALAAAPEDTPIRKGVAITHRDVMQLLRRHGVERIEAHRESFDPRWHEAIDVVSAGELGVDPGTVVQVTAAGYRRGERLFRPARVVVAR